MGKRQMANLITRDGVSVRLLAIGGLLLALLGAAMTSGFEARDASGPGTTPEMTYPSFAGLLTYPSFAGLLTYPSFVLELETIRDGTVAATTVLTYNSIDEWLYEEFDVDGSLLGSQRLESGRLTRTYGGGGASTRTVEPGQMVLPPASDWFIDSISMLAIGGRRLGSLASFERDWAFACGSNDHRCAPGETVRVTQRVDYDPLTGIPIGYSETHNGVVVVTLRATRLTVN